MADLDMTKRENLIVHIDGLQATITKRNQRIAELEAQLSGDGADERTQRLLEKEFRRGWRACADHLMGTTATLAIELGKVRKGAYEVYLQAARDDTPLGGSGASDAG